MIDTFGAVDIIAGFARHFQVRRYACGFFDGFNKTQSAVIHQKAERRTVGAAAEAVIKLLFLADGETRAFFPREMGTAPDNRARSS